MLCRFHAVYRVVFTWVLAYGGTVFKVAKIGIETYEFVSLFERNTNQNQQTKFGRKKGADATEEEKGE